MSKVAWKGLITNHRVFLSGKYFEERPSKVAVLTCVTSKSFLFAALLQVRTKYGRVMSLLAGLILFYSFKSDIARDAHIGESVLFPHPFGIVIGGKVSIKGFVIVFDHTSFGKKYPGFPGGMPQINGRGLIGTGAKVLGELELCGQFVVGANAVQTQSMKDATHTGTSKFAGVYFARNT